MARTSRTLLAGAALTTMAVLGSPGTASAAQDHPTAYNTKTQFLDASPDSGMAMSCVERSIYLATGDYRWGHVWADGGEPIRLPAGTYTWTDCLDPQNGYYTQQSRLRGPGGTYDLIESWQLWEDGTYEWGSYLDPQF
ncbi:hypothetical protein E1265_13165 [Streptomyces sp. 8K308]|uniref:hypothetical protein n=1 Tax=Streptomyces sp. 8K308 TaxID=2530388 RepID=UPI0010437284|nr:hypothetical protein [Streptomyces sp. 8K308]TDC23289.1 hypothetical protein E1265_13165 [Streptomyces sp. 8K308]